jgi:hypothetical protein
LELWRRLELDRFFEQAVDDGPADMPWSRVAALSAINPRCAPGSELAIEQRWYPSTALDDLLGIEEGKIHDTRLYRWSGSHPAASDEAGATPQESLRRTIRGRVPSGR